MTKPNLNENLAIQKELLSLAKQNGLLIVEESLEINESGMDFRVAFATDEEGRRWVLRQPRREDVWERAENERKVLDVVRGNIPAQVPDWRIFTPELIAYPLLDGDPIAVVDPAGEGMYGDFLRRAYRIHSWIHWLRLSPRCITSIPTRRRKVECGSRHLWKLAKNLQPI